MINNIFLSPHPPIIIPEIGKKESKKLQKTTNSFDLQRKSLENKKTDTLVIISPHTNLLYDKFHIISSQNFYGDFSGFENPNLSYQTKGDIPLAKELAKSLSNNFSVELTEESEYFLDHGALVPLYFLTDHLKKKYNIILIGYSLLSPKLHFKFGKALGQILENSPKNIAIIASGDMSHRLTPDAPAGYTPSGKEFDLLFTDLLEKNQIQKILKIPETLLEEAGECGFRSALITLGAVDNLPHKTKILSYEGPFGVGYLAVNWELIK